MADGIVVGNTATTTAGTTISTPQEAPAQPQEIDYDKLASILDGKIKVTEDSVLKGYMKQQGLTGDEMNQAIEMFKQDRASKMPNIDAMNQEMADMREALLDADSRALLAETKMMAMGMASELGVEARVIPYILNSADISDIIEDGEVNEERLKESLEAVLQDLPELRAERKDVKKQGFKIGADTSKENPVNNDELARIFGVKR